MREFANPQTRETPLEGNLTDDVVRHAQTSPGIALFSRRVDAEWHPVTAAQFHAEVTAVARGLIAAGIRPGDRVALLSRTRYEWTLCDYAIWCAGAVSVPIYETSSPDQVQWILADSGARAIVVEDAALAQRVEQVRHGLPELQHLWSLSDDAVATLTALGSDISADDLEQRRTALGPNDPATLIYTSGTTGSPKGCVLTHGNFLFELDGATEELHQLFDRDDATTLLFLPLAHVFARIIQVGCVKKGVRLGHSSDIKSLTDDLSVFQPTFVLAVPRVFEKVFNTASQRATADGRGAIFQRATDVAIAYSRALDHGRMSWRLRAEHALYSRLVYGRLRGALGGRCEYAVSGGAPLGERLGHFFRGAGITILEGYGLTETTAALTVNTPDSIKVGSVGRPLPGTHARVASDGELLFRGGQIFQGYWNNAEATAGALTDGWFHTGDLGEIDEEGNVSITGRKKEIIVTAGGKNVAPALLEDRVRAHPLVSQCLVVGDGQPFIAALITLDQDSLTEWATTRGKPTSPAALTSDPELLAELQEAIDTANATVSKAESIRKFVVLGEDWTEEGGQLTPSLKLKRHVVMRDFKDQIAQIYL